MCLEEKKLQELERKKKIYLEHGQHHLVKLVVENIKYLLTKNIKEKPLFQPIEHPEEELKVKTHLRTCSQCGRNWYSPRKTTKQTCILCKISNGSEREARKDFDLLIQSNFFGSTKKHQENE